MADNLANIYRSTTGVIKTDGTLTAGGGFNLYDGATQKLAVYLNGGTVPSIDFNNYGTTPNNLSTISLTGSSNSFSLSFSSQNTSFGGATYPSTFTINSTFGSPQFGAGGPSGTFGYGPYFSFTNTQTGDTIQLRATGGLKSSDGTQANPSISFQNNQNTGFFLPATNVVRLSCGGSLVAEFQTAQITLLAPLRLNSAYTAIASGIVGYVTVQDSGGTTRKLAVMA